MKMRFMTAVWLSLVLLASGLTAAWTDDPNASIVQGSAIGTPLPVTGAVTSTVNGTVTSNQGTAGASPWLVDVNNWLPYPWQMTFNGVAQPVTAAQSGSWTVGISGTPIILSSQSGAWTVGVNNFPSSFGVTQGTNPWTISGTVTTNQGTSPWLIGGTLTTNVGPPGANNLGTLSATANASAPTFTEGNQVALSTDLSGNLRVVTTGGNTVTQGTSPWIVGFNGVAQPVTVGNFPVTQTVAGTVTANQGTSPWLVDGSAHTQPVSGTVTANAGSGTFTVGGTVTANQGTTPWVVDGSGAIQPVSGTVTANAGSGTFTVGGTVTANAGSGTFTVDGSGHTQPVSATSLPLPTGAATEATLATLPLAQGSTTSGQSGTLAQGAVTTAAPTYTTAKTSPLSLNTAGGLRVDGSGVTQPVSGTVTANAGSGTFTVGGTVTANAGSGTFTVAGGKTNNNAAPGATNVGTLGAVANAAAPTWTEGNLVALSTDLSGNLRTTATATISGTATVAGNKTNNNAAPGATNIGALGAVANAAAPSLTEGNLVALSSDLSGRLRTDTSTVGGTAIDVNSGTKSNGTQRVVLATDQPTNTNPLNVQGTLTNNNAAPSTNNVGVLPTVANAAAPTRTEGNLGTLSSDLLGYLRMLDNHPTVYVTGTLTRPANTTTYTANTYLATSTTAPVIMTLAGCARVNGGTGRIVSITAADEANQTTKPAINMFLFDSSVTVHNDDAAMAESNADLEHLAMVATVSTNWTVTNAGVGSAGNMSQAMNLTPGQSPSLPVPAGIPFQCQAGSTSLFALFEMTNAYVPISAEKFVFRIGIIQD